MQISFRILKHVLGAQPSIDFHFKGWTGFSASLADSLITVKGRLGSADLQEDGNTMNTPYLWHSDQDFLRLCKPFSMTSSSPQMWYGIIDSQKNLEENICPFLVSCVSADDLIALSARIHTMSLLWEKFQWILPLYMKPISFQSKASVVCSVTAAIFIDFCLKKLNVFSQHIG